MPITHVCRECGSMDGSHLLTCSKLRGGHRINCKLSCGGKFCTCDYYKRKAKPKRQDGMTWIVSIIHPDTKTDGSTYWMERAGKSALEAAKSYLLDREDNEGAELARKDREMVIVCVVPKPPATPLLKSPAIIGGNKVYLFEIDEDLNPKPFC